MMLCFNKSSIFVLIIITLELLPCFSWVMENCSMVGVEFSATIEPNGVESLYNFTEYYTTIELDNSTGARALDGTNYKFFVTPGRDEDTDKFMIYWQGGKFCGSEGENPLESCYNLLNSPFGSSKDWPSNGSTLTDSDPWGPFSSIEEANPLFWKWNKVRFLPLDGANYLGYLEEPINYNGTEMWIRGYNNTMASLEYMRLNYGLFNASEIMLLGGSMGGVATMVWALYLKDYFPSNIKISIALDGSLFLDMYNEKSHCYLHRYMRQAMFLYFNLNGTDLLKNCPYQNTDNWKCIMLNYIYEYIDYPVFFSNTQTDYFEISNYMSVNCVAEGGVTTCDSTDRQTITKIREHFLQFIFEIKKKKPNWGFYIRSCFEHTLQFDWSWYGESQNVFNAETCQAKNLKSSLYEWYLNTAVSSSYIDLIDWLHNPLCTY